MRRRADGRRHVWSGNRLQQVRQFSGSIGFPNIEPCLVSAKSLECRGLAVCSRDDDLQIRPQPPHFLQDLAAGHSGQGQIQQNHVDLALIGPKQFHPGISVARLDYGKASFAEHLRNGEAEFLLVLDHQDSSVDTFG